MNKRQKDKTFESLTKTVNEISIGKTTEKEVPVIEGKLVIKESEVEVIVYYTN